MQSAGMKVLRVWLDGEVSALMLYSSNFIES
jgi:hypothetical protein